MAPSMTATVQVAQPGVTDPELMWLPTGSQITLTGSTSGGVTTWKGTLPLPFAVGSQPMRVVIGEHENYLVAETGDASQRLTYFDAIPI
jgi:hypothetical protein